MNIDYDLIEQNIIEEKEMDSIKKATEKDSTLVSFYKGQLKIVEEQITILERAEKLTSWTGYELKEENGILTFYNDNESAQVDTDVKLCQTIKGCESCILTKMYGKGGNIAPCTCSYYPYIFLRNSARYKLKINNSLFTWNDLIMETLTRMQYIKNSLVKEIENKNTQKINSIRESISHWIDIWETLIKANGKIFLLDRANKTMIINYTSTHGISKCYGASACALCKIYFNLGNIDCCRRCPFVSITGKTCTQGVWSEFNNYLEGGEHGYVINIKLINLAKAMIDELYRFYYIISK